MGSFVPVVLGDCHAPVPTFDGALEAFWAGYGQVAPDVDVSQKIEKSGLVYRDDAGNDYFVNALRLAGIADDRDSPVVQSDVDCSRFFGIQRLVVCAAEKTEDAIIAHLKAQSH
jgi:hypothetical protein